MEYVQTNLGRINLNDIPIVKNEPLNQKFYKAFYFFIILILILMLVYLCDWHEPHTYKKKVKMPIFAENVARSVKASALQIYDDKVKILVDNIIIRTSDNNIVNIDVLHNHFVQITKYGNGLSYYIDFGYDIDIDSITIVSDEIQFIKHVNLDLLKNNEVAYSFSDNLQNRRDNTIFPSTDAFDSSLDQQEQLLELADVGQKKIIINEKSLYLELNENDEQYGLY
jgi:hypothetical protein